MPRAGGSKEEAETSVSAAATDGSDEKKKDTGPFAEGEKVLAYHGPLIYEAKTQKAEYRKKEWRYYVHYLGWSKSWDEWVDTKRLLKITDANIAKQKKVHREAAEKRGKAKVGGSERKEGEPKRGKKRKADANEAKEEEPEQVVKLPLSSHLKKQLIDDWKHVTENNKLVPLPRNPTVNDILQKYLEARTKKASAEADDATGEVVDGLRSYFDKALPAMLLYSQERDQFNDVIPEESDISPSNIYGAEHLLRLFVKLPELLVYTNMEEASMAQLQAKLIDFLKFLQKNQTSFFLSSYVKRKK